MRILLPEESDLMRLPASVRRRLRPIVLAVRQARRKVGVLLRPERPWDGQHHPSLLRFGRWEGNSEGAYSHDFLGVKTDPTFRSYLRADPPGPLPGNYPPPDYNYFELIFVLESILAARDASHFRMIELGAGYGPWLVIAHRAMRRIDGCPVDLVGVEMVPQHFRWMEQHFRNNGIDPARHRLIHAAVSDYEGRAVFRHEFEAGLDFGQQISDRLPGSNGRDVERPRSAVGETVRCITLRGLLEGSETVDLIHIDVQGEELRVLQHAWDEVDRSARRVIVATHSKRIHRSLRKRFIASGWSCRYDFPMRTRVRTELGDVHFLDGLLAFTRPG